MAYDDSYLKLGQSIANNYQANLDKLQQQEQIDQATQEAPGRAEHLLGSFTRGLANTIASVPQGIEALGYGVINKVFGTKYNPETMLTPFDAVSKAIRKLGEVGDLNPEYQNDFSTKLASGAGSILGYLPLAVSGPLGYAGLAAAGAGESQSDYAQKLSDGTTKFDPNVQFLNSLAGAGLGLTERLPLAGVLGRAGTAKKFVENLEKGKKLSKGRFIGGQGLRTAAEEGLQEAGANIGRDFVAKSLYDPNREIGSTAGTEGAVGGVLGGVLGAGAAALGLKYGKFGKLADYYQSLPEKVKQSQLEEAKKANLPENVNINPVTNQEYQDKNLIKANEQIARYQQILDENIATADPRILDLLNERINNIRKEISDTYFAKDEDGKYVKSEIERQEAEDFLATTVPTNNITIESPFNMDFQAPDTSGISVEDITNKKDLKKYGKLFASQSETPKVELPTVQEGQTSPIFDIVDQEGKADTGKIQSLQKKLREIEDAYPSMTAKEKVQAKKILQQGNEAINRALENDMLNTQASSEAPSIFGIETGTEEVITSNKGTPYATKASALRQLKKQKLDNTHQVIPFKGGYALAPKLQGISGITVEEIFPDAVQAVPGIEGIKVEELPPEVLNDLIFSKEFERDLIDKYSDKKPSNPVMAEALQSVKDAKTEAERRKALREAYDAAVEERKAKEIKEAYRQRELQDAVAPVTPEKVEVVQKPNTEEKIDEVPPEGFTSEEWSSLSTEVKNIILNDLEKKKKEIKDQEELKPYKKDLSDLIEEADKEGINTSYYKALLKKDKLSPVYLHDAIQNLDYKIRSSIPEHFRSGEFNLEELDPNEIRTLIKEEPSRKGYFERAFYKKLTDEIDKLPAYNDKQQQKRLDYQLWADDVLKSTYSDTAGLEDFQEVLKAVKREKDGIIVAKSGFPYKTAKIAQAQLKRQKLTDTHEVIPYEDGFALKEKEEGDSNAQQIQETTQPNGDVLNEEGTQKVQEVPTSETSTGVPESGQGTQVQEVEVTQTPIEDRIDEINDRLDELDLQLEQTESGSEKDTLLFNETKALEKERKLLEKALKQGETELPAQKVAEEPTKVSTEKDNLILTKSGKPYKTEAAAKRGLTSKKLTDTHEVIPYEGGYVIAPKKIVSKEEVVNEELTPVEIEDRINQEETGLDTESTKEPIEPNVADTVAEISRLMQSGDMLAAAQLSQTLDMPIAEVEELVQKYEADQLTPTTEEAVIEDTPTGKVEVEYTDRDMLIKEIEKIDEQLDTLDAAMIDLEDNYGTPEEKAAIRTEIKKLNAKKQKLFNQEKKISKAEEDAAVTIDRDKESNEDDSFFSASRDTSKTLFNTEVDPKDKSVLEKVIKSVKSKLRSHVLKDIDIIPVSSLDSLPKGEADYLIKRHSKSAFEGLFVHPGTIIDGKPIKKARIYIVTKGHAKDTSYLNIVYHELVGHYGLRKMLGDMLTPFKEKLLLTKINGSFKVRDPKFAAKVFSLHTRWKNIDLFKLQGENDEWIEVPDIYYHYGSYSNRPNATLSDTFRMKQKSQQRTHVRVSKNAMLKLTEEYLSELAADYSKPEVQKALKKKPLYKRYISAIRHALRKIGFGKIVGTITDEELMEHIAQSHTRLMVDGVQAIDYDKALAFIDKASKEGIEDEATGKKYYLENLTQKEIEDLVGPILERKFGILHESNFFKRFFSTYILHREEMASAVPNMPEDVKSNISEGIAAASAIIDESIRSGALTEDQARRTYNMYMKGFGLINKKNFWNKKVNPIIDRAINKIRDSKYSHQFLAMGKLPARELYSWVENIAKGHISKGEIFARKWSKALMDLPDNQSEAVYNFFKTKGAKASDLPVSKELQKMAEQAKNYIDEFGERLVNLGLLDRDTFEKNRGSYLPIVYYKYMKEYAGSGKKMSFANYLKKKADLPDAERQAMGQMKDPGFLVAHTIATLSRDIALHEMFNNIRTMSEANGLGWVIPSPKRYKVDGRAYSIEQLEEALEELKLRYSLDEGTKPNFMNSAGKSALESKIGRFQEQYAIALEDQKNEFKKILIRRAEQNGEVLNPEDITDKQLKDFRTAEFRKIDDIRFGKANKGGLNGQYVRIEIYNDLVESTNMFNKEHSDFLGKIFGEGGTADKAHQYWKLVKVAGNPPSWFRNGISNALLLDMATDTNFGSLLNMIVEEGHFAIAQKRSKWSQIAHDYGVFSTTWAAVETSLITRKYQDKYLADIKLKQNDYTKIGYLKALFDGKVADMLEKVSAIYGGIEGVFKTVAIRDHIQRWEKNTGKKFDNLVGDEREAVIMQAVEFANKAIFDYSKVPQWVRFARRTPFVGAPFITFTMKAIPATIEGFARHPQKMIKYAMLPYAMMQAWLLNNDLDDDDWDEIQKNLPTWQREKGSLYLLPWKDSNGNLGVVDIGYYLPWSSIYNAGLTIYNEVNKFNPITSLGAGALKALQSDLGILGGLFPTMGVALATGIDPFTDREIVDPINTEEGKAVQYMRFMSDLVFPSFLTSRGALGKTMDYFGVKPTPLNTGKELTTFGTPKQTALDVAGRYVGLNTYSVNLDEAKASNAREISAEIYKYKQAFNKVARDMNMSSIEKAAKIRSLAEQMKYKVQKYQERVQ